MGIQVELPTLRKNRLMGLADKPTKESKEIDHESWQWGVFENLTIDDSMPHPNRLDMSRGDDAATLADSPDASSAKRLISPFTIASSPDSPSSPSSPYSVTSSGGGGCVDPLGGSTSCKRLLKKSRDEKDLSSMSVACNTRWDSGRWSGENTSFEECNSSVRPPKGNGACKCAAGLITDVAVVCCCPFSLLHLLAIAFIKLPTAVVSKTMTRIKNKVAAKRKRAAAVHEEEEESTPATSYPPSRCRSYESGEVQTWAPALSFGDQKMWKDYFDSPDNGAWSDGEFRRGKS